jgi:hypothetical protein
MSKHLTKHDKAIRERAERMWREDGCPGCGLEEYLERARELQAFVEHPNAALKPNPMTLHHGEIEPLEPIEEAELQDNLGEFPTRTSDQGDHLMTPMTKAARRAMSDR